MPNTLFTWNEDSLSKLPVRHGFRQRGMSMTRLETFTDAAFAFAVTLLVISVDDIPNSYEEFIAALKQVPAFIACFMQLMLFWWGHHSWSRRFGLEDGLSMVCSLALVAAVLIYIYPLRVILGAFFANASDGALPYPFELNVSQIGKLFVVYGVGFTVLAGLIVCLHLIALKRQRQLCLDRWEVFQTQGDAIGWGLVAATGLVSFCLALALPDEHSASAGFVYWTLAISMPAYSVWFGRRSRSLRSVKSG